MALKLQVLALFLLAIAFYAAEARVIGKREVDFSGYCSKDMIPLGSSFWQTLNMTLTDVINSTPFAPNLTYTAKHSRDDATAYGQGVCFNLGHEDCQACISMLVKRAWAECSGSIAAILVLTGQCSVRYQDTPIGSAAPFLNP